MRTHSTIAVAITLAATLSSNFQLTAKAAGGDTTGTRAAEHIALSDSQQQPSTQTPADEQLNAVFKSIESLLRESYPKAKLEVKGTKLHCEWKCKQETGYYSGLSVLAPQAGGIVCDLSLEPGQYSGSDKDRLPSEIQDGFHTTLTMAPYSKREDKYLLARLSFPPDLSTDFKENFKSAVNTFTAKELADEAAAAKAVAAASAEKEATEEKALEAKAAAVVANTTIVARRRPKLTGEISGGKISVFVSTDDNTQGNLVAEHQWWGEVNNSSHVFCDLEPGVKNYLHIIVEPPHARVMLGWFGLEYGATFSSNGLTSLDTRPAYWLVSNKGWGIQYHTPKVAYGSNNYLIQCPVLNSKYPGILTICDPQVGEGYDGKIYFSTCIDPMPSN